LPGERTLKLVIEYDGTLFHGWQVQDAERTVQGELEDAFEQIVHEHVHIQSAGRTDAGVHALGQTASLRTQHEIEPWKLMGGLNALTGPDVSVKQIEEMAPGFCARRSATGKLYRYRILNAPSPSPLRRTTHLHVIRPLDVDAMRQAASLFEGHHDFEAFRASDCERHGAELPVESCTVARMDDEVVIEVRGPGFCKNMVRIMAGTLLWVGSGRLVPADVGDILASRDRGRAGPTAKARGLVLVEVTYGESAGPSTSSMP
jgi:tRNA pseudouridine38-40 synthase